MFLKINNLIDSKGNCDYKNLNYNKFIKFDYNLNENICILETTENLDSLSFHDDLQQLSEEEFKNELNIIKQNKIKLEEANKKESPEYKIEVLTKEIAKLKLEIINLKSVGDK